MELTIGADVYPERSYRLGLLPAADKALQVLHLF